MDWLQSIIGLSFVVIIVIGFACGCIGFCKARYGPSQRNQQNPGDPCIRCQLIEMREAACYTGYCPECGRIPPRPPFIRNVFATNSN